MLSDTSCVACTYIVSREVVSRVDCQKQKSSELIKNILVFE